MSGDLAMKRSAAASAPGTFTARIYLVDGPPDGDGDVIAKGAVQDGHPVVVSGGEHDAIFGVGAPNGHATLHHASGAVIAVGHTDDPSLRAKLLVAGPTQEWSLAWPTATAKARLPTPAEVARWPDARRVIEQWNPIEISPVDRGACGPTCRTLAVKCAGGTCTCGKTAPAPRPRDLVEWLPTWPAERTARRAESRPFQRVGE